jgi:GNAT superfamily N-acetyltransferase
MSYRLPQLHVPLDSRFGELVRAFVRETSMSEEASTELATNAAGVLAQAWERLCGSVTSSERVEIRILLTASGIETRAHLRGLSRFRGLLPLLGDLSGHAIDISWRECGIDGWELTILQHSKAAQEVRLIATDLAHTNSAASPVSGPEELLVDLFRPSDAASVGRCFLAVYGHAYVHPEVFSPRRLLAEIEQGEVISVVTRDTNGEVVGHLSLRRGPSPVVAERGEAVVLPEYRGHGLLERMTDHLFDEAPRHNITGIYAEPLTVHVFSQKNDERARMPVCAALLGVNPESFHPKNMPFPTAGQRQSYLRTFRFMTAPEPRVVAAPVRYREILTSIYRALDVRFTFLESAPVVAKRSRISVHSNVRGFATITFDEIGLNAELELSQSVDDMLAFGAKTILLSCPIDGAGLQSFVDAARVAGFFFCGIGPAFAKNTDMLLMQKLTEPLDVGKLQLMTDLSKQLVAFINSDRPDAIASS